MQDPISEPDDDQPDLDRAFAEPWQARAFSMAVLLNERGHYPWPKFSQALASELGDSDHRYYESWLDALEKLVVELDLVTPAEIQDQAEKTIQQHHDHHHDHSH